MNSSYKLALIVAALLCALVVGYYAWPSGEDDRVAAAPTGNGSEPSETDGSDARPSALRNGGQSTGGRSATPSAPEQTRSQPGDRTRTMADAGRNSDAMNPLDHGTGVGPGGFDDMEPYDTLPPAEDPGVADDGRGAPLPRTAASDDDNDSPDRERRGSFRAQPPAPSTASADEDDAVEGGGDDEPAPGGTASTRGGDNGSAGSREVTSSSAATSQATEPGTYTVAEGDTLSSIAEDLFGHERHWVDLARANPRVDPMRLRIGQELRLPDRETIERRSASSRDSDLESPPGTTTHIVRSGETLSTIAQRHYNDSGRWRVIFNANRDKLGSDPDRITAGDELTIPPLPRN